MEQTVKERIRWLISREKIPAYRFEMAWSDYARTNILLCKAYMGHIAFDLDISDHVIAMGLYHETGKTNTNHFYINNGYRKLDRANRMVIDYVEGKIELD